jgi:ABC-type methionine transport system ATPase subunit
MDDAVAVIQANSASARVGDIVLFENVNFVCHAGEWILVRGASGAGKTSLLRAVNGLQELSSGWIEILGSRLPGRRSREARAVWRNSGTVLQDLGLFESRTARANVELALQAARTDVRNRAERARVALEQVGLGDLANRYPSELSAGQRQRVALARAIVSRPRLLLLDEPTSALDHKSTDVVLELLAGLKNTGTSILMSSHRIVECVGVCDRVIEIEKGRIIRDEPCRMLPAQSDSGQRSREGNLTADDLPSQSLVRESGRSSNVAELEDHQCTCAAKTNGISE